MKISKNNIVIAHGGDISVPGGGPNRVIAFARTLQDHGFNVNLVVQKPKKEISKDLEDIKIHTVPIKKTSLNTSNRLIRALLISLKAKRIAKKNNAILQIEHSTLAGFATLVGCSDFVLDMHDLCFASPVNVNLHFSRVVQKFIYNMEKRAVIHASKIVVVSNTIKDFIMKEWDVPEEKIEVIPNGYFESKLNNFDFKDIKKVDGMISFLGTLHPKLDLDKIVELAKSLESSKIYIIGDGDVRSKLVRKIKKHNLRNVILTGKLPDEETFRLLAKSQAVILPEYYSIETEASCPVKLFDYAALGKAIVADDVSEMCRLFRENNAALVSDPSDHEKFIENVRILLEDEDLRRKLGENARQLVKDFTWEKQGEKLVKIYKEIFTCNL